MGFLSHGQSFECPLQPATSSAVLWSVRLSFGACGFLKLLGVAILLYVATNSILELLNGPGYECVHQFLSGEYFS
jgi:hypothetical protein